MLFIRVSAVVVSLLMFGTAYGKDIKVASGDFQAFQFLKVSDDVFLEYGINWETSLFEVRRYDDLSSEESYSSPTWVHEVYGSARLAEKRIDTHRFRTRNHPISVNETSVLLAESTSDHLLVQKLNLETGQVDRFRYRSGKGPTGSGT